MRRMRTKLLPQLSLFISGNNSDEWKGNGGEMVNSPSRHSWNATVRLHRRTIETKGIRLHLSVDTEESWARILGKGEYEGSMTKLWGWKCSLLLYYFVRYTRLLLQQLVLAAWFLLVALHFIFSTPWWCEYSLFLLGNNTQEEMRERCFA